MRHFLLGALIVIPLHAWAATDFISPGTPKTVGQGGAILGKVPDQPVPAPRGAMGTLGLPDANPAKPYDGPRISRDDARNRIERSGFSNVIDLLDDGRGGWRGRAEKGGHAIDVQCNGAGTVTSG